MSPLRKCKQQLFQNFLDTFKIVLVHSQIYGLATFNYSNAGFQRTKSKSWRTILAILIYLLVGVNGGYRVTLTADTNPVLATTTIIIVCISPVYIITTWILSIANREKIIDIMESIIEFDNKMFKLIGPVDYTVSTKKLRNNLLTKYTYSVITFLVYIGASTSANSKFVTQHAVSYFVVFFNLAVCFQCGSLIYMIRVRFALLNKELQKMVKTKNFKQSTDLYQICAMHHHLSKSIHLFNETFGVIFLLLFSVGFVGIVLAFFYFTAALKAPAIQLIYIIIPLMPPTPFILEFLYICGACHSTIEEANKSSDLIYKIDTQDRQVIDEIEMFFLQIANEHIEFSAADFFPVNYTLVFSIVGGVTTYIIILIQLASSLQN